MLITPLAVKDYSHNKGKHRYTEDNHAPHLSCVRTYPLLKITHRDHLPHKVSEVASKPQFHVCNTSTSYHAQLNRYNRTQIQSHFRPLRCMDCIFGATSRSMGSTVVFRLKTDCNLSYIYFHGHIRFYEYSSCIYSLRITCLPHNIEFKPLFRMKHVAQ